uniref:Uncharacterized protein n=1 Tax=Oryza brachyantha TaxID=4533 RepID=J3NET1_ORYBR
MAVTKNMLLLLLLVVLLLLLLGFKGNCRFIPFAKQREDKKDDGDLTNHMASDLQITMQMPLTLIGL